MQSRCIYLQSFGWQIDVSKKTSEIPMWVRYFSMHRKCQCLCDVYVAIVRFFLFLVLFLAANQEVIANYVMDLLNQPTYVCKHRYIVTSRYWTGDASRCKDLNIVHPYCILPFYLCLPLFFSLLQSFLSDRPYVTHLPVCIIKMSLPCCN